DPWPGPMAVWSSSDGLSFRQTGLALAPCTVGQTLDDLPAGPTARWHLASFRVQLYGGALRSVSDSALFAGANAAAVQRADGAWEVIQFSNAELMADRVYLLSRLLRGQAGSEWATGAPLPAGSPFVLLDAHLVTVASGSDALERRLQLRVGMAGRNPGDPTSLAFPVPPHATALKPLAPVHLKAARVTSGVTISWIRRTRVDGDTWVGEVPLSEDIEQYTIDILSGDGVVRTLKSTTPSVVYASADEVSDFGGPQVSLH